MRTFCALRKAQEPHAAGGKVAIASATQCRDAGTRRPTRQPDSRNLFEAVGFEADYGARRILGAGVVELSVKDAAGTTDIDTKRTCPAGIGRDRIRLC